MNKTGLNKTSLFIVLLSMAILLAGLCACGEKAPAAEPQTTAAPLTTPKATTSTKAKTTPVKTPTPTKAAATPKLNNVAFNLALENGQKYIENTIPIFMRADQTLHMNWLVVKGGEHFYMTITLPDGKLIRVNSNGTLSGYTEGGDLCEKLVKNGDMVFTPEDYLWTDGYYLFHPQLHEGDAAVSVKLIHWLE